MDESTEFAVLYAEARALGLSRRAILVAARISKTHLYRLRDGHSGARLRLDTWRGLRNLIKETRANTAKDNHVGAIYKAQSLEKREKNVNPLHETVNYPEPAIVGADQETVNNNHQSSTRRKAPRVRS